MSKLIITLSLAVIAAMVFSGLYISKSNNVSNTVKPNFTQFHETETKISESEQQNHTVFVGAAQLKSSKQTLSGVFEEANKNFFEQVTGYMGYDANKKEAIEVKFRPDLSNTGIVYGNGGSATFWGMPCTSENGCTDLKIPCLKPASYLGVGYGTPETCVSGSTYIYFDKDQSHADLPSTRLDVDFTALVNTTWPLGKTAMLGMAPNGKYLKFVLETYDLGTDGYEFSFFYDILLKENRFDADKAKAFDITMTNFGQNKDNLQDSGKLQIVTLANDAASWTLPIRKVIIDDSSAPEIVDTAMDAVLVNSGNEYFAMGASQVQKMKDQILVVLDCKQECTRGKLDLDQDKFHTTYYDLQVQLASGMLTMKVPIYDLVYFKESSDKDDSLQYSIADITAWVNSGVVPSGTKLAMGRQFLINTYLTFTAKLNGERTISIGQLSDMGKITSTERLWLMLFGVFIVCLILLALLMKLCKKKGGDKAEDYKAVQNS